MEIESTAEKIIDFWRLLEFLLRIIIQNKIHKKRMI